MIWQQFLTNLTESGGAEKERLKGLGVIYRRGKVWWIKYSVEGRRRRESTKSERKDYAIEFLSKRVKAAARDQRRDPVAENRVTMAQLFADLEADYAANGRRSSVTLAFRLAPLREAFGHDKAKAVTTARIAATRRTGGRRAGRRPRSIGSSPRSAGRSRSLSSTNGSHWRRCPA